MEITGRITKNATVQKIGTDKQVVNFSIATNDSYKPKGSTEFREIVTYVECAYWLNAKSADWLLKGSLVQRTTSKKLPFQIRFLRKALAKQPKT